MPLNLSNYDSWKLSTPPHFEDGTEPICPECGRPSAIDDDGYPELCLYCAGQPAQCPLCDAPSSWDEGPDGPQAAECPACQDGAGGHAGAGHPALTMEEIAASIDDDPPTEERTRPAIPDDGTLFI